jgi:monovalent cation/hydrogen antiporter
VHPVDLVVCLLIVLAALVTVARRLNVSYPIVLVIGGLVLALFPRLPEVRLEPDIVFLVFLPPLLYWDALNSSWRDFRDNWRPISLLAIGLVFTTTMAVMLVAHFMLGFPWARRSSWELCLALPTRWRPPQSWNALIFRDA